MDHITIEEYQNKDFESVIALLVHSFKSKFCHRQNLSVHDIKDIISASWDLKAGAPAYIHFVAKQNQNIVGVILIHCSKKEMKEYQLFPYAKGMASLTSYRCF
ncbi:hypothetical protein ABFV83_03265 [Lacrimispora sp. BS-2]|uniref:Uncharacterized protein n=1 Tax=Lacrimispora sp. BS-2 TaxID=3151850 RepID=A0AAU7PTD9_9FIRM